MLYEQQFAKTKVPRNDNLEKIIHCTKLQMYFPEQQYICNKLQVYCPEHQFVQNNNM